MGKEVRTHKKNNKKTIVWLIATLWLIATVIYEYANRIESLLLKIPKDVYFAYRLALLLLIQVVSFFIPVLLAAVCLPGQ